MLIHITLSSSTASAKCYLCHQMLGLLSSNVTVPTLQSIYFTSQSAIQVLLSVTAPGMNSGFPINSIQETLNSEYSNKKNVYPFIIPFYLFPFIYFLFSVTYLLYVVCEKNDLQAQIRKLKGESRVRIQVIGNTSDHIRSIKNR